MEHCSVEMFVEPCIIEDLRSLMKDYSHMLTLLKTAEMSTTNFGCLKKFLSTYCDDMSLKEYSCLDCLIEQLEIESIIYLFNIDTLIVCCTPNQRGTFQPYFESKVCGTVLEYREQIKVFLDSKPINEFRCSLRDIKEKHDNVEVTLKLKEPTSKVTAKRLLKIPCQIFGITGKRFHLREVRPGCVCVTWCVPTSLVPTLREKAEQLKSDLHIVVLLFDVSQGTTKLINRLAVEKNFNLLSIFQHSTTHFTFKIWLKRAPLVWCTTDY